MASHMAASLLFLGAILPSATAITLRGVTWPAVTWAEKKYVCFGHSPFVDVNIRINSRRWCVCIIIAV